MANQATLYKFEIEISDVDRGVYETVEFRIAMHPSESSQFLITRVLAFSLNYVPGLEFTPQGLSDPDAPALRLMSDTGNYLMWIEIGTPSAKKLHKASKTSPSVKVYTYKDPKNLKAMIESEPIHKKEQIEFYSLAPSFLDQLAQKLERNNKWTVMNVDSSLSITANGKAIAGELNKLATG